MDKATVGTRAASRLAARATAVTPTTTEVETIMSAAEVIRITGRSPLRAADHHDEPTVAKVAVVIPALNEAPTIRAVVEGVPRTIPGVAEVEVILVDDGSTDGTQAEAIAAGVDAIAHHPRRRGLVSTFKDGVTEALRRGASIVVNLDGDGQHDPAQIPALIAPILANRADIVLGVRDLSTAEMTPIRRHGNMAGTWVTRRALGLDVSDVTTGFRAFSRDALLRLNVTSEFTYTLETLVEAARKRLTVAEVPVPVRPRIAGTSRMTHNVLAYITRTGFQAMNALVRDRLVRLFGIGALVCVLAGAAFAAVFLVGYRADGAGRHLPALLAALMFVIVGVGLFVSRLIADGIETSRRLLEETLYMVRRHEVGDTGRGGW
jgi:glycosyltransferase involved in cell wall biosynthesis